MLILSIVLAAMAPVMTTRNKTDQSSPWRYSEGNLSDAYYGLGESQTAMIGQREFENTDETAKLIINSSGTRPSQIAFKRDGVNQGILRLYDNTVILGKMTNTTQGQNVTAVGSEVNASRIGATVYGYKAATHGENSIAIGAESLASGQNSSIAIGYKAYTDESESIAIGTEAKTSGQGDGIAIGNKANGNFTHSIAIGSSSLADSFGSIAIGNYSKSSGTDAIAIGPSSETLSSYSISLGREAKTDGKSIAAGYKASAKDDSSSFGAESSSYEYSTAIGKGAVANYSSIAIGNNANANPSDPWAIAIGNNSIANKAGSIAIGDSQSLNGSSIAIGSATANGSSGIAMGFYAAANGTNDIAIGNRALKNGLTTSSNNIGIGANACSNVTGSNKICIGANSGPDSGSDWAKDTMERVFIGSKSKYNGAPAVLEVFNDPSGKMSFRDNDDWGVNTTGVVVNGNLIVKGLIYSVIPKFKDGYDCCSTGLHGRSGGQMESAGLPHQLTGYFGNDFVGVNTQIRSDKRLKYVGKEFTSGLDKIRELKVFNYTFKKDAAKEPRVGVIAQDLQKVFPDAVKKGADGFFTIRMEDMFYAVINSIKELDARVTALEKENAELKSRLDKLEAKIK